VTFKLKSLIGLLLVIAFLGTVGCSGGSGRSVKPVNVTVTYKGSPVADAAVTFVSDEQTPTSAFGKTDAQGVAKPTTPQVGNGVVVGRHKVIISKEQVTQDKSVTPSGESSDFAPPDARPPTTKDLVPTKYKAPGTTPLVAEVTASGPNDFKFDLTD